MVIVTDTRSLMKGRTEKMAKRKSSTGILAANGIFDKKTEQVHKST